MEIKQVSFWIGCFILTVFLGLVSGNGRMLVPPQRSSLWRDPSFYRFRYVYRNYNDHTLNCGGFWRMHQNNGKCGVCGDAWDAKQPRANEAGGIYARGVIGRTYSTDKRFIDTVIQVTSSISGYFEFNICPNDDVTKRVSRDCLDNFPMRILSKDRSTSYGRRYVPDVSAGQAGVVELSLEIPEGLECTQCVLQWRWHGANNYGLCRNGRWGKGCGEQPEMYNCADIAIIPDDKIEQKDKEPAKPFIIRPRPIIPSPVTRKTTTPITTSTTTTVSPTTTTASPTTTTVSPTTTTVPPMTTTVSSTTTTVSPTTTTSSPTTTTVSPTTTTVSPTTTTVSPTTTTLPISSSTTLLTTESLKVSSETSTTSTTTMSPLTSSTRSNITTTFGEATTTAQYVPTTTDTLEKPGTPVLPTTERQTVTEVKSTIPTSDGALFTDIVEVQTKSVTNTTPNDGTSLPSVTTNTDSERSTVRTSTEAVIISDALTTSSISEVTKPTSALTDTSTEQSTLVYTSTPAILTNASNGVNDTFTIMYETPTTTIRSITTVNNIDTTSMFEDLNVTVNTITEKEYATTSDVSSTRQPTQTTSEAVITSTSDIITQETNVITSAVVLEQSDSSTNVTQSRQTSTVSAVNTVNESTTEAVTPSTSEMTAAASFTEEANITESGISSTSYPSTNTDPSSSSTTQIATGGVTTQPSEQTVNFNSSATGETVTLPTQGISKLVISTKNETVTASDVKTMPGLSETQVSATTPYTRTVIIGEGNTITDLDQSVTKDILKEINEVKVDASNVVSSTYVATETNGTASNETITERTSTPSLPDTMNPNQNSSTTDSDLLLGLLNVILELQNRSTTSDFQSTTNSAIMNLSNITEPNVMNGNGSNKDITSDKADVNIMPNISLPTEQSQDVNTVTAVPATDTPISSTSSVFGPSDRIVTSRPTMFTGSVGGRLGGGNSVASLFPISRLVDIDFNIKNGDANLKKKIEI